MAVQLFTISYYCVDALAPLSSLSSTEQQSVLEFFLEPKLYHANGIQETCAHEGFSKGLFSSNRALIVQPEFSRLMLRTEDANASVNSEPNQSRGFNHENRHSNFQKSTPEF